MIKPDIMDTTITKKPVRQTVAHRILAYCKKNDLPFESLSLQSKQEIGNLVLHKFNHKEQLLKTKLKEPEGEFEVLLYPSYYVPIMDGIIKNYFKGNLSPEDSLLSQTRCHE